jgi:hypothetical protein
LEGYSNRKPFARTVPGRQTPEFNEKPQSTVNVGKG